MFHEIIFNTKMGVRLHIEKKRHREHNFLTTIEIHPIANLFQVIVIVIIEYFTTANVS